MTRSRLKRTSERLFQQVKAVIPDGRMKREARVKQEFHRTTPSIEPLAIGIIAVREETPCEILETFSWDHTNI
jgi:hypothetical protein